MKIIVTGPESCGKSRLAGSLAEYLHWPLALEQARAYLQGINRVHYHPSDLLAIAQQQEAAERGLREMVCDTDLQVLRVWWSECFGPVPTALQQAFAAALKVPRVYLLCAPDLPWQADPLREHPHDRERLFTLYQADLERLGVPYRVVRGQGESRLKSALDGLQRLGIG